MRKIFLSILIVFTSLINIAQEHPVQFGFDIIEENGIKVLKINAKGINGAKIISISKNAAEINSEFEFEQNSKTLLEGSTIETGQSVILEMPELKQYKIAAFSDVEWKQKIKITAASDARIKGNAILYYASNDGSVNNVEFPISKQLVTNTTPVFTNNVVDTNKSAGNTNSDNSKIDTATKAKNSDQKSETKKSIFGLFIAGFLAGLLGFITPCVYALVPVTVSMFMKRSKTKQQGRNNVLFYAFSIMAIYTLVGLLTGVFFTNDDLQNLSAHWLFNLIIFILFVVFGLSFLGWFEIALPSSWATKMDSKANTNSYFGIFFMALTLVIVSFSCTGPFVGSILGASFKQGKIAPALGMFGFGLGLAAPFAIFAIFPKLITVLTKSGGWQNAVKVTLGFIELAASLKFLSQADLVKGWRILDREVFIVLWIAIFLLLALYLLGKIRFKLDSELPKNDFGLEYVPVPRLMLALTSLAFVFYLIPGLWGAPLKAVSGFVPTMGTQDFNLDKGNSSAHISATNASNALPPKKWVNELKVYEPAEAIKNDFVIYYDFEEAKAAAKAQKKPLLIDITGITCVNCRKFEGAIWPNPQVASSMKNDFVLASIFLDAPQELDDVQKIKSEKLGRTIQTLGDYNKDIALNLIGNITMPNYLFIGDDGKLLHAEGYGYEPTENASLFLAHLNQVKDTYKQKYP
jgi:thiol:disulfide interchange protein